jgi:hypothetical protein
LENKQEINKNNFIFITYFSMKTKQIKKINLIKKEINKLYNVNINNTYEYIYWNNMIFIELSEELLINFKNNNINLEFISEYKKYYNTNKHVIVIDILKDLTKMNTPYSLINPTLLFLQKFGSYKINNLQDLRKAINKHNTSKIKLQFYNNMNKQEQIIINC